MARDGPAPTRAGPIHAASVAPPPPWATNGAQRSPQKTAITVEFMQYFTHHHVGLEHSLRSTGVAADSPEAEPKLYVLKDEPRTGPSLESVGYNRNGNARVG